ncbi:hypothetical protein [Dyella humicola]|uniref:hypothetical protein n=1 Tax=Dyella humicola TaxID=2992126 RepID=UPI00225BB0A7|nr:hypothetical protein [Dyella humicola]
MAILFAWEGRQGFSLWDEGYLWYGVQRVMAGEVPIRDFQAYDPGRYYWSALLMRITGAEGIVALRYTLAVLQAGSLAAALGWLAATCTKRGNTFYLVVCALTLVAWMVPRHKSFDISISIALVCVLACWVRRPVGFNYFLAGLMVGLAAYVGRNHGMYGAVASSGVFFYLALRCEDWGRWRRGLLMFVLGGFAGYLPMLATMFLARGFTPALIDNVRFLFEIKATNLPLPVPWPWRSRFGIVSITDSLRDLVVGLFFVSILVYGCLSTAYVLVSRWNRRPVKPLLVACAFCAIPYAHYAFSRADTSHLAQGIFPTLIGMLVLAGIASPWPRALIAAPLCALSLFVTAPMHSGWQCMGARNCTLLVVGSDRIRVDRGTTSDVLTLRKLQSDFAPDGQSFFVMPFLPGAYALLGAKAPTWEIFTAWHRDEAFQKAEIAQLKAAKPAFVLIQETSLDGRDELRYKTTHPLIERYVRDNYIPVNGYTDNPTYQIYLRGNSAPR